MSFDKRTLENLAGLNPIVREKAESFLSAAAPKLSALGIVAKVISGLRSWQQQAQLYAQGRTAPGKIVTKAPPGSSWHNFGLAFDLGLFDAKTGVYLDEFDGKRADKAYTAIAPLAEELGLEWAGRWKVFCETPHFQYTAQMKTLAQARTRFCDVGMRVERMIA